MVFAATIYYRLGAYKPVVIEIKTYPALHLLYKEHLGPYHKINDVIVKVEAWSTTHNLHCPVTFGEYFDDPRSVEERRLRSNGGCILTDAPQTPIEKSEEIFYRLQPEQKYLVATFEGAPSIGPMKVYPKVEDFLREHRMQKSGPVIEIYHIKNATEATTEYLFAVAQ
jgi:AraC family transcriptional regulator